MFLKSQCFSKKITEIPVAVARQPRQGMHEGGGIPIVPEASEAIGADLPYYKAMSKDELIEVIMKKEIEVARAKKALGERRWKDEGIQSYKRLECQAAMELSARWPIKALSEAMSISRSGYCKGSRTPA